MASGTGRFVLVATPIGNLGDLSRRAAEVLASADLWIVEDTRVSGKLQAHLQVKKPMRVLNDHTGDEKVRQYAEELSQGAFAALVTDGGSPAISDPGARLTDLCLQMGIEVDSVPGPSAVTNALALSGFFAQRFCFLGFLGRKPGDIKSELRPYAESPLTLVLFESPYRFEKLLPILYEILGDRRFAICREMTKLHQQVVRGSLSEGLGSTLIPQKGEFAIVIEGKRKGKTADK